MQHIIRVFQILGRYSRILPLMISAIFIITSFLFDWIKYGFLQALMVLAKTLLSAELIINENVHKAILNQGYGLIEFIEILISLYILYEFVRFWALILTRVTGSQALYGSYLMALVMVFIIEIATVKIIDGKFGFIPLYNGVFFLLMNLHPVFFNIIDFPSTMSLTFLSRKIYKQS